MPEEPMGGEDEAREQRERILDTLEAAYTAKSKVLLTESSGAVVEALITGLEEGILSIRTKCEIKRMVDGVETLVEEDAEVEVELNRIEDARPVPEAVESTYEKVPLAPEIINEKAADAVALAKEIVERGEVYVFPGVSPETEQMLKEAFEQYPEYTPDPRQLLERFKKGMKIVFGLRSNSGNVFALPVDSKEEDFNDDAILIENLASTEGLPDDIQQLIALAKVKHR